VPPTLVTVDDQQPGQPPLQPPRSPGQAILNDTGARQPEHSFHQPVPITARIVWEQDGEEHVHTVALGWTGRDVYVRLPDPRYRLRAVWLDASDVRRR
jgi:hypothetical protein